MPAQDQHRRSAHLTRCVLTYAAPLMTTLLISSSALAQEPAPSAAAPQGVPSEYGQPQRYGAPPPSGQPPTYGLPPGYYLPPSTVMPGPKTMDYEEGQTVPPGYHVATRARRGLIIGGAVTFGSVYLISAFSGLVLESADRAFGGNGDNYTPLYIPIAGPFVAISTTNAQGGGVFVLMLDGLAQAAGAAMLIGGLAVPVTKLVRDDISLNVHPIVDKSTVGLGVSGTL